MRKDTTRQQRIMTCLKTAYPGAMTMTAMQKSMCPSPDWHKLNEDVEKLIGEKRIRKIETSDTPIYILL